MPSLLIFAYGQTAVKRVITKALRSNYFRERRVFWRKKSNQQEDAFLIYFRLPCPPQGFTKFIVSSRGSTLFFPSLNISVSYGRVESSVVKRVATLTKAVQELVATFLRDKVWGRWLAIFAAWQRTNLAMMWLRAIRWHSRREHFKTNRITYSKQTSASACAF